MIINANNGEIIVEGKNNVIEKVTWSSKEHLTEFLDYLIRPPSLGGTYYPEPDSMQAAYAGLCDIFYDRFTGKTNVTVTGNDMPKIPQPMGPDAIY